jgi:hypothetical protein
MALKTFLPATRTQFMSVRNFKPDRRATGGATAITRMTLRQRQRSDLRHCLWDF